MKERLLLVLWMVVVFTVTTIALVLCERFIGFGITIGLAFVIACICVYMIVTRDWP